MNGVNDAPVANPDTATVYEDGADQTGYEDSNSDTTIIAGNVLENDTDADTPDTKTVTGVAAGDTGSASGSVGAVIAGTYGNVNVNADGSYTYTLDNTKGTVQALAVGETFTDTFTYTMKDSSGAESSTTLTITIQGTNDTPEIRILAGDSIAETLTETNAGLTTAGTLSIFDVDTSDIVTAAKVGTVGVGGTYTGPALDEAALIAMFNASGGDPSITLQSNPNGIAWTFNSNGYAFNEIPAGQTLVLTYTVRATDNHGAYDDQEVTITITGTNDDGSIIADIVNVNEDIVLTGNVLDNDIPDPDYNEPLVVKSFTVDSNGDGSQNSYNPGDSVIIKAASGGTIGTLVIMANGDYTFTPQANYSGSVPVITYTAGNETFTGSAELTITVTPVSDAPGVTVDAGNIVTLEDTAVSLGLNLPTITDNVDQNGAQVGDSPERIGAITLSGIPVGAQLLDGLIGGGTLWTSTGGSVTIVLSDQPGYHIDGAMGILTLTTAQFEALKVMPPADSGVNFTVTMTVSEYEVNEVGVPLAGIDPATSSASVVVDVQAVTDGPVDLKINGGDGPCPLTINEDSTFNLKTMLSTLPFNDTDGSEQRSIIISGLPAGTRINGIPVGAGGSFTLDLTGPGNTILPDILLTPPLNFSGDITGIKITLQAQDTDPDSSHTPEILQDSVFLNLYVNPVAGDVAVSPVSTPEDTAVNFLNTLILTDTDGSENITAITVKGIPTGWVVRDEGGAVVFTGNGSTDYTVPAGDVASGEYKNYTIIPPAHSSADATLTLTVTTIDSQIVNGVLVTSDSVTEDLTLPVVVHPVAEIIGSDSDGDGTIDLTMNGNFNYTTHAREDVWFRLDTDGFDFKTPWTNQDADGSEKTFALLTPVIIGGSESANGSQFSYYDGTVTHYLTYFTGSPVAIPMEYLDTVQFIAAPNVAGSFQIQVQAKTVDTDPDTNEVVTAISGSAVLTNLVVEPVADLVTLAVSSPARGNEDEPVTLSIRPSSVDPSETFTVTISGIPAGSVLKYNGVVLDTSSGIVVISDFDQSAPLTILPPFNSNVDFNLNVSAVSVDTSGGLTDVSAAQSLPIFVDIQGVADPANLTISSPILTEAGVDGSSHSILLSNFITGASLTDTDGSETLSLILTGLDPKFSISGATFVGGTGEGRQWLICSGELANCKVTVPPNFSGTVDFDVRAVTTENDGNSWTGPLKAVSGTITPSPEAAMVTSTVALEDTLTKLNFDIQHRNGDTDEEITSVSLKISDVVGKGFSLFLGETGTTLAAAAGVTDSGVTIDGDFYKISGTALNNIWAKGDPNSSGEHTFDIRYEVTDPSSDGTLTAVASTTDGTYTLTVNAVTDDTTTTLTNLTANDGNAVISGTTVTASGTTTISMDVVVQQVDDPNAGNTPDTDGSEKLLRFVIDGVPDGVTVQGGVYIGDTPGNPNTGQWLVDVSPDLLFTGTGSLTQTLVFELEGTAALLSGLNETITIRAVSQDTGSTVEVISSASFTLTTPPDFDASAPSIAVPAEITEAEFTPLAPEDALEDGGMNLNGLVDFTLTGSSPFSITLTGIPAGAQVSGMTLTMVNGEEIWTASGTGGDLALQNLLSGIIITPPENWNDNNHTGGLTFEAKLTTYTPSGEQNTAQVNVIQPVTPVSDPTEITIAAPAGIEDSNVNLTISVGNDADGEFNTIVEGKLYISLNQAAMDSSGKLYYEGVEITAQSVSGVSGIPDGNYYVLTGVDSGDSLTLTYEPGANSSGSVTLTAALLSIEDGASDVLSASEAVNFSIVPVNDGATVSALSPAIGAEDTKIQLNLEANLIDTDGSESILSAVIGNLPVGYLVFAGADAASAVLATNLGSDGTGNSWAIGLTGGALPAYVAILPPEHFSGTVEDLTFSILSGENGLTPTENTANFDITITPVADGITLSPTLSFGTEGQGAHLNLNSSMVDTDGSETVTLTLTGLGDHAAFSVDGGTFSTVYDGLTDTYTLSGIQHDHIDTLSVIQSAGTYNLQVTAYTVDGSDESSIVNGTFNLDIAAKIPTAGDDILLYKTGGSFDGREGIDTLLLRPGEDIDFADDPLIRNMEILDLDNTGANHVISNLTVQDVLDITDGNNDLKILGNSGDTVNLLNIGTDTWQHTGTVVEDTITFDVYASALNSDITVKIQQEINDNLV